MWLASPVPEVVFARSSTSQTLKRVLTEIDLPPLTPPDRRCYLIKGGLTSYNLKRKQTKFQQVLKRILIYLLSFKLSYHFQIYLFFRLFGRPINWRILCEFDGVWRTLRGAIWKKTITKTITKRLFRALRWSSANDLRRFEFDWWSSACPNYCTKLFR